MTIDLSVYDKYLVATADGLVLSRDAPKGVVDEIDEINREYKKEYGINLVNKE